MQTEVPDVDTNISKQEIHEDNLLQLDVKGRENLQLEAGQRYRLRYYAIVITTSLMLVMLVILVLAVYGILFKGVPTVSASLYITTYFFTNNIFNDSCHSYVSFFL